MRFQFEIISAPNVANIPRDGCESLSEKMAKELKIES